MKKVLIITYYWPPSGGPGVQRALKFVRYLPEFGYIPYVITVDEKKASYALKDESLVHDVPENTSVFRTNTFEPFWIYGKISKRKNIPHSGFANEKQPGFIQKISRFIRGNFFIPDARKGWNRFALEKARKLILSEKFDAIITTSPPHSTQLLGLKLSKETGIKWIADLRDPWTDIYYYKEMFHLPFAKKKDAEYEKAVLENANEILVVSNAIKNIFLTKSEKINSEKIHVIPNGYDNSDFEKPSKPPGKNFIITYTGTIANNYGIENFINVFAEIEKENKDLPVMLRFVGEADKTLKELITNVGIIENVEYINYVPHKESVNYLLNSTILLLAIPRIKNNEGIITGKLFEYLASQKPIICIGPVNGDAAKIIEECKAGKTFAYDEKYNLKLHLKSLIDLWKIDNNLDIKNTIHQKYSRINQAKKLSEIIANK